MTKMFEKTIGFIGGGRVTRIILGGFKRKNLSFKKVVVSDINPEALKHLKENFLDITVAPGNNPLSASGDIVFMALHPSAVLPALDEIKSSLKRGAVLISLAPKIAISKISERLEGFNKIARMIPNACAIVNHGYNPVAFSTSLDESERKHLMKILAILGDSPEVDEDKLEAYAVLTGMGPTSFWFQWEELARIGEAFGIDPDEARKVISHMIEGAAKTLFYSNLTPEEVMDLIPARPLMEEEGRIREIYRCRLEALPKKLKNR
jgi:pyrroline-5-carboxylate reductase